MKVAILIMSTDMQPSLRNVKAMKDTFVKYSNELTLNHEYDFYEYYYDNNDNELIKDCVTIDNDPEYSNYYIMRIGGVESVYRTYEKTYIAYDYLINHCTKHYDKFVRINISTYINIKLLDMIIENTNEYDIYANALNTFNNGNFEYINGLYPRGDFYIASRTVIEGVLKHGKHLMYADTLLKGRPNITHVDDTLFGYAYIMFMGDNYYEHLHCLKYNFIPQEYVSLMWLTANFDKKSIGTRLKTVPEGQFSGYSWDDNTLRECEPEKMNTVHNYVKTIKYNSRLDIDDIIEEPHKERYIYVLNPIPMQSWKLKEILKAKNNLR